MGTKGLPFNTGVGPQDSDQLLSKREISVGKLKGESWKDRLEIASILEVSRAKEARAELSIREADFGERLGDGRLPCPRKTIQPEHVVVLFVLEPAFELQEDIRPCSP